MRLVCACACVCVCLLINIACYFPYSSQGDISSALSCFGENGIEDEFFQQYADFTVILEPYLGPTEGMSLKSIIDFMTNFCPILGT